MDIICEYCGKPTTVAEGIYMYYPNRMMFACKACGKKLDDEIKCGRKICAAVDGKKSQAETILNKKDSFDKFLGSIKTTLNKIPDNQLVADISMLVSLTSCYIKEEYKEIPYQMMVGVVATLLYVISPVDIIPDILPGVGFTDDALAIAFCKRMIHDDMEMYIAWSNQRKSLDADKMQ